jgi:hypothetical protein
MHALVCHVTLTTMPVSSKRVGYPHSQPPPPPPLCILSTKKSYWRPGRPGKTSCEHREDVTGGRQDLIRVWAYSREGGLHPRPRDGGLHPRTLWQVYPS